MAGVWFGHGLIGQIQLVETVIFHRPKHIPPSRIERLWALIALGAPVLKGVFGMGRIANGCIVAIILIVGLSCSNAGVRAIAFGHKFYTDGNSAAGTRVRKVMQTVKTTAQDVRLHVQETKNS